MLRSWWSPVRRRLSSPSGFVSVGLVLSLLVGSVAVAVGQGASRLLMELGDGAAWLPTDPRGTVTLVDGSSGRPTAEVRLASGKGSALRVVERDGQVFVLDTATGVLTRIDGSTFEAPKAVGTAGSASSVLTGDGVVFVVDAGAGVVRVLDATTLEPVGEPIDLGAPVQQALSDSAGNVYVLFADGSVKVVGRHGLGATMRVAADGESATLTVAAGTVQATDSEAGKVIQLTPQGLGDTMEVPELSGLGSALSPNEVLGDYLAYVVPGNRVMALDTRTGDVVTIKLPASGHPSWGQPVVSGAFVYVPDTASGELLVIDLESGSVRDRLQVTQGTPFDLSQDSGIVFANDPASDRSLAIDDSGVVREVSKYDEEIAKLAKEPEETPVEPAPPVVPPTPSPEPAPAPAPAPAPGPAPAPAPAPEPGPGTDPGPPAPVPDPGKSGPKAPELPAPPPPPAPAPAPGQPTITGIASGNRSVTVDFAPAAAGGQVDAYELRVSGGMSPTSVTQSGPTTFTAAFDACATLDFVVVAKGPDGETASAPERGATCAPAGAVTNLRASGQNPDTITAAWDPPASGDGPFTYTVTLSDGQRQDLGPVAQATFTVPPGTYTVTVVATGADGTVGQEVTSSPVTVSYVTAGPVEGLDVVATGHTSVRARWSAPASGTGPFAYQVQLNGGAWQPVDGTAKEFGGLNPSTKYTVGVRAVGKDGQPGPAKSGSATTDAPPLPPTKRLVECTDNQPMPGGGRKTFYGNGCRGGTSSTGYALTVYESDDPRLVPLKRFVRNRDTDKGFIPDYALRTGDGSDLEGFTLDKVIGYVPKEGGASMDELYWDHWDGSWSWKSWSYRNSWPGFQPEGANTTRDRRDGVFRVAQ